jgi:hypothetical protein
MIRNYFLLTALCLIAAAFASSNPAIAACKTVYGKSACLEEDDGARCLQFEREQHDECTPDDNPNGDVTVSPPSKECFKCKAFNKDRSCKKAVKISC